MISVQKISGVSFLTNIVSRSVGRFSVNPTHILGNIKKISYLCVGIFAASNLELAQAGPVAYAACLAICSALTAGGFLPACAAACAPALAAPTP